MVTSFTPFYVQHSNYVLNEQGQPVKSTVDLTERLGDGICIGVVADANGGLTMLVLWDKQRWPSPSAHTQVELAWTGLVQEVEEVTPEDEEEYEVDGEEDGEEEYEASEDEDGGEFSNEAIVPEVVEGEETNETV